MTLVVNLYGGPGTGKSTIATGVFSALKMEHRSIEYVGEYAKDLTWTKNTHKLQFQPRVIGEQMWRIWRLFGQVDVVITDSPILLGCYYASAETPQGFYDMVRDYQAMWNTLDVVLERSAYKYDPRGRNQTLAEAVAADTAVFNLLEDYNVKFRHVQVGSSAVTRIKDLIEREMSWW